MSNLMNCPTCDREVSENALACPQCGHKLNDGFFEGTVKNIFWFLLSTIGLIIVIAAIMGNPHALGILWAIGILVSLAVIIGLLYRFFSHKQ